MDERVLLAILRVMRIPRVKFAEFTLEKRGLIEKRLRKVLPEFELGHAISRRSPIHIKSTGVHMRSKHKIDLFYSIGLFVLVALTVVTFYAASDEPTDATIDQVHPERTPCS
jgi:hypothetical protein